MSKKIMLVDDAKFTRSMIRRYLDGKGEFTILEAENGEEAITLYENERPDLVFLDITMPKKNGIETLTELKQLDDGANVIMCSALGQEHYIVEALRIGAKDFIVKPFSSESICKAVEEYCGYE